MVNINANLVKLVIVGINISNAKVKRDMIYDIYRLLVFFLNFIWLVLQFLFGFIINSRKKYTHQNFTNNKSLLHNRRTIQTKGYTYKSKKISTFSLSNNWYVEYYTYTSFRVAIQGTTTFSWTCPFFLYSYNDFPIAYIVQMLI